MTHGTVTCVKYVIEAVNAGCAGEDDSTMGRIGQNPKTGPWQGTAICMPTLEPVAAKWNGSTPERTQVRRLLEESRYRQLKFRRRHGLTATRGANDPLRLTTSGNRRASCRSASVGITTLWLRDGRPILYQRQTNEFSAEEARRLLNFCALYGLTCRVSRRRFWCWHIPRTALTIFIWRATESFPLKRRNAVSKSQKTRAARPRGRLGRRKFNGR